ncbi:MAG: hypothetical protein DRR19_17300 [Candidatus Parabeggiatoa sp. nov. 1]|nr:MAG: hypothetical protein DRR19_17300 [Gammaproteobacteria bacterium]
MWGFKKPENLCLGTYHLLTKHTDQRPGGGISQSLKTSQAHKAINYLSIAIKAGESTNDLRKMPLAPFKSRSIFIPPASMTLDPPTFFNS